MTNQDEKWSCEDEDRTCFDPPTGVGRCGDHEGQRWCDECHGLGWVLLNDKRIIGLPGPAATRIRQTCMECGGTGIMVERR